MYNVFGLVICIIAILSCGNESTGLEVSDIIVKEYIELDWRPIAIFQNAAHIGTSIGDTEQCYYGLPVNISADRYGILLTLFRSRDFTMNNELIAYDWSGSPIWMVSNLPIYTTTGGTCIIDSLVVSYVHGDIHFISIYNRLSGNLVDSSEVEFPKYNDRLGGSCYDLIYVDSMFIGTSRRNQPSLVFMDHHFVANTNSTRRAFEGGCNSVSALAHSEDRIFAGESGDFSSIQVFNTNGEILDTISIGYRRTKPHALLQEGIPVMLTLPIEDMQFRNDSLWVLVGTSVFPTDSSELWIIELNSMEASVIPFNDAVHSFALYLDTIVISKTNVQSDGDNTSVDEDTELCVAKL